MKKFIIYILFIFAILLLLTDYNTINSMEYIKIFLFTKIPALTFIILVLKANKVI
jgi:hypothetical protein